MILKFFLDEHAGDSYMPIWIGNVRAGDVVRATTFTEIGSKILDDKFGHIVGFARDGQNEILLEVKWDTGLTHTIHPGDVQLLRG